MKKLISLLLAICLLTANAYAATPEEIIHSEEDGLKYIVKTFELPENEPVESIIEDPFELLGYSYCLLGYTKNYNEFEDSRLHTEMVTIDSSTNEMTDILAALEQSIFYDQDGYSGELHLDHKSIGSTVAGYSNRSYTVSDTKTIPGLERNDPSLVPKISEKSGVSLALTGVTWSVDAVDEDMNPVSYTATASYSAGYSSRVANGYTITAAYTGTIAKSGVESVVYELTYVGEKIEVTPSPEPEETAEPEPEATPEPELKPIERMDILPILGAILLLLLLIALAQHLRSTFRNVKIYTQNGAEYALAGRRNLSARKPIIDAKGIRGKEIVFEIKAKTARRLFGKLVTVRLTNGERQHLIEQPSNGNYWFSITI